MSTTKYIFVTGGVSSSLGKGIIAASLAKLLQARGYRVTIQKHEHRSEHWHVVKGSILMELDHGNRLTESRIYWEGQSIDIPKGTWHKATNVGSGPAKVIEVWLGDKLEESDIERRD